MMTSVVTPWYAYIVNYLVSKYSPPEFNSQKRKRFFHSTKSYLWDEPFLYKKCVNQLLVKCVDYLKTRHMLTACHEAPYGGHFGGLRTTTKVLQSGYLWSSLFKDAHDLVKFREYLHEISDSPHQHLGN